MVNSMSPEEVKKLNEGRYKFREEHSSTTAAPYRRHPGHVLVEDFLVPIFPANLSTLAYRTRIPVSRYHQLIRGQDRIDERMAEALGRFFRNGKHFWLDLQKRFERGEKL